MGRSWVKYKKAREGTASSTPPTTSSLKGKDIKTPPADRDAEKSPTLRLSRPRSAPPEPSSDTPEDIIEIRKKQIETRRKALGALVGKVEGRTGLDALSFVAMAQEKSSLS